MPTFPAAFKDRMSDLLDAYALGDIDRATFVRRMEELNRDYYDAIAEAELIEQAGSIK